MAAPTLTCPQCARPLEYHATIEMLNPPVGKVDTGYCGACRKLFERIRDTETYYDTTLWPPLCRACRQPVTFAGLVSTEHEEEKVLFHCQTHPSEQWVWNRPTERWMRTTE
jgi:hypothetical protein